MARLKINLILKRSLSSKFCAIIGSGPAGFYTAQGLFKNDKANNSHVHIFEKLPVPFGLVRYGVAPDHPDVKNVINKFTKTASHPNFRFFGNVEMGKDVTIADLRRAYDAVVLCYGADSEKKLNIPGEDANGVYSARTLVGWYNGSPNFAHLAPDFSCSTAVVIGHGNVAVDVARILLSPLDHLAKTDITSESLEALSHSQIRTVHLAGRRGPLQVAFTTGEFRELTKLPGVSLCFNEEDFANMVNRLSEIPRPKRRLVELMLKQLDKPQKGDKKLFIDFFKKPVEIIKESKEVCGVKFAGTALVNPQELSPQSAVETVTDREDISIDAGLVVKSIGYRGVSIDPSLPFDNTTGTVTNDDGRVRGMPGMYCSGWIGRGAVGVIAQTLANATHVAKHISSDLSSIVQSQDEFNARHDLRKSIIEKLESKIVDWPGWLKIDATEHHLAEQLMGKATKPREKLLDVDKMIEIAHSHGQPN